MHQHLLHLPLRDCRCCLHRRFDPRPCRRPGKNSHSEINLRHGKKSPLRLFTDPFYGRHINRRNHNGKSQFRGVQVRGSNEHHIDLLRRGGRNRRGENGVGKCQE